MTTTATPGDGGQIGDPYVCALCGEEFLRGRGDEEAMREYEEHFGGKAADELVVICDGCWNRIHPQRN